MNDFDYDCMQKKRIASGAVHRKRGSKSKKCTLPSDYLTKKELKAMNGEVKSYNIHERYDWKKFKELPDDIAIAHINWLIETFGCTAAPLAESLGCSKSSIFKWLKAHDIQLDMSRRFMGSKEWLRFLGKMPVVEPEVVEENVKEVKMHSEPEIERTPEPDPEAVDVSKGCEIFSGNLSLRGSKAAMLQGLFEILPDGVTALRVVFSVEE